MLILLIAIAAIFVFSSFSIQVVLHELGHFVFGLLTGWKLTFIQVCKLVFYHDKRINKYKFTYVSYKGFQCIMNPVDISCGSYGYTLGGLIFNFISTVLALIVLIKMGSSPYAFLFFLSFILSGIALLISNGIPKVKNLCNDMACFLLTKGNKITSQCHNTQLIVAGELMQGKTYARMNEELFNQVKCTDINDISAYSLILNYYYHLDKDEFKAAHKELIQINELSKISNNVLRIYKLEFFYLYMVMSLYGCKPLTSSLLPHRDNEMSFVKENAIPGDLHSLRVRIMYQAYRNMIDNDINKAVETLEKGADEINNTSCIYPGEKLFCEDQLRAVCNMLKRMAINKSATPS